MSDKKVTRSRISFKPITAIENSILVKLWRKILRETNMINALEVLAERYANKSSNSSVTMVKKRTKSRLMADATTNNMSWKIFVTLIFGILNVKKMTITVKLDYPNGESTIHSVEATDNVLKEHIDIKELVNGES